jgi:hypothetical protein
MTLTEETTVLGGKSVSVPQIPHGLVRDRRRASAVRGRRLTARAMARTCRDGDTVRRVSRRIRRTPSEQKY